MDDVRRGMAYGPRRPKAHKADFARLVIGLSDRSRAARLGVREHLPNTCAGCVSASNAQHRPTPTHCVPGAAFLAESSLQLSFETGSRHLLCLDRVATARLSYLTAMSARRPRLLTMETAWERAGIAVIPSPLTMALVERVALYAVAVAFLTLMAWRLFR